MKQELKTKGAPELTKRGMVSGRSFNILFSLASSDSWDVKTLGHRLGMSDTECADLLEDLHQRYLVDLVSRVDGRAVSETLSLTDEGQATLLRSLEQMCELPE